MKRLFFVLAAVSALALPKQSEAKARPHHQHEDLFGEKDLWLGFKGGPKISGYTDYNSLGNRVSVQSEPEYTLGGVAKFIYGFPRLEINALWNVRTGVNSSRDLHFLSIPVLVKAPIELDDGFDLEFGGGMQGDLLVYSNHPSRRWLMDYVASVGTSYDFITCIFEFEIRYVMATVPLTPLIDGASPRDIHFFGGLLWRF